MAPKALTASRPDEEHRDAKSAEAEHIPIWIAQSAIQLNAFGHAKRDTYWMELNHSARN